MQTNTLVGLNKSSVWFSLGSDRISLEIVKCYLTSSVQKYIPLYGCVFVYLSVFVSYYIHVSTVMYDCQECD